MGKKGKLNKSKSTSSSSSIFLWSYLFFHFFFRTIFSISILQCGHGHGGELNNHHQHAEQRRTKNPSQHNPPHSRHGLTCNVALIQHRRKAWVRTNVLTNMPRIKFKHFQENRMKMTTRRGNTFCFIITADDVCVYTRIARSIKLLSLILFHFLGWL